MKKIVIRQKNVEPLILEDNCSDDLHVYTRDFSKIMESSKICIVEISSGNVILKPSEISSIVITENNEKSKPVNEKKLFDSRDVLKD